MAYTIADGLADIRHELGGDLVGIDPIRVLNEAGRKLYGLRDWNFLVRVGEPLESVAAQSWIALPEDFGQIVTLNYTNGLTAAVYQTTLNQVDEYRSQLIAAPSYALYCAVSWIAAVDVPAPRLEVFPAPTTSDAALLTLTYRVKWVTLDIGDQAPIPIPDWFEGLYRQCIRATASGYQRGDMAAKFGELRQSWDFEAAVRQDSAQQSDYGGLRNGAMSMGVAGDDVQWQLAQMPLPPAPG